MAWRDSEITTFSGCEPLNSRDPCSRREAATSKRVRPWARGEGCASQLCSRSSELCCEPSGVPWKPLLSEGRGRGTTLGSRTGVGGGAGSALREVGMVLGPTIALSGRMWEHSPHTPGKAEDTGGSILSWVLRCQGARSSHHVCCHGSRSNQRKPSASPNRAWGFLQTPSPSQSPESWHLCPITNLQSGISGTGHPAQPVPMPLARATTWQHRPQGPRDLRAAGTGGVGRRNQLQSSHLETPLCQESGLLGGSSYSAAIW